MGDLWVSDKELADLKPWISSGLAALMGAQDEAAVSVVSNCLQVRLRASLSFMRRLLPRPLDKSTHSDPAAP